MANLTQINQKKVWKTELFDLVCESCCNSNMASSYNWITITLFNTELWYGFKRISTLGGNTSTKAL